MKTEFEKMQSEECPASYNKAKHICAKQQRMTVEDVVLIACIAE